MVDESEMKELFSNLSLLASWIVKTQTNVVLKQQMQERFKELYPKFCHNLAQWEMEQTPRLWDSSVPAIRWVLRNTEPPPKEIVTNVDSLLP